MSLLTKLVAVSILDYVYGVTVGDLAGGTCEDAGHITHFDWDELMSDIEVRPNFTYTLDVDESTLSLVIDADLEYLGDSFADDHTPGFGTTYILDFEDYNAESDNIRQPGNCQNRVEADFSGSWHNLWSYSDTPYLDNHVDNDTNYLAYPQSGDYWNFVSDPTAVCSIHYHAEFNWDHLRACSNYDNTLQTVIKSDENWLNLTGVFYINIVSPLALHSDTGYYRVYQQLSAPFVIAVRNSINIISSVGINLFTVTIIAVYKEDLESDFRLIVLTESADFLMLESPQLLTQPTLNPDTFNFTMLPNSINTGCLSAGNNLCSQLWEIYANNVTCPPTNFTGLYGLQYQTACNPDANYTNGTELCNNYINTYGSDVALTANLEWLDEICDPEVFIVQFSGEMTFYNDTNFENEMGPTDQYSFGDVAYVEVSISLPSEAFDIFGVTLDNVWVCTTNPENEPLTVSAQSLGTGGCLGSNLDFSWHIVISGAENDLTPGGDVTTYTPYTNGTMRFSFNIDSSIERTNLYVHVQASIDLSAAAISTTETPARRRMLLDVSSDGAATATQARHFDGATGINTNSAIIDDDIIDDGNDIIADIDDEGSNPEVMDITTMIIIGVVGVALINICVISICLFVYCSQKKNKTKQEMAIKAAIDRTTQKQIELNVVSQTQPNVNRKNTESTIVYTQEPGKNTPSSTSQIDGQNTPQSTSHFDAQLR